MSDPDSGRTARIRALARTDADAARRELAGLLADLFDLAPANVEINLDRYSLNSLNGFFEADGRAWFFKFHQEEGEEAMSGEYYRADILARAGLPVDRPVMASRLPGEQILVYPRRTDPRFSEVLRALDLADDPAARATAVAAERRLAAELLEVYRASFEPVGVAEVAVEPIHRLFHDRLVDPADRTRPGGRFADYYIDRDFALAGLDAPIAWNRLSRLTFVIGGRRYRETLGDLFAAAIDRLAPDRLADAGGVVAHGDAHNANVWFEWGEGEPRLTLFDPAFAGEHVPSLLAEVKATFHNVFAHPLWLYDPALATERFSTTARVDGNDLLVSTDWALSPIRRDLLAVKARHLWRPLLAEAQSSGHLPADWRRVVRLALFLCPTLVMNLRAGVAGHTPATSLLGLAVAVMVGSEPIDGRDVVTDFLDAIDPDRAPPSHER